MGLVLAQENPDVIPQADLDHTAVIEWVWRYFTSCNAQQPGATSPQLNDRLTGPVFASGDLPASPHLMLCSIHQAPDILCSHPSYNAQEYWIAVS
jgi:hypothetical protein